ncbi:MAG: hypothetical protein ABL921_13340 [Pirellula sp.]
MLNYGIFRKTLIDSAASTFLATIGLIAFVLLFVWAMLNMGAELLSFVSKFAFLQKIFEMSLGIKVSGEISLNVLFSACFTHLIVMTLAWAVIIATATRVTVGEMECGTADLLLSLPVHRSEVYISSSAVWILAAVILSFAPLVGIWIGTLLFETAEAVVLNRYIAPATNFLCLNLAIGGVAAMFGCILNRRSITIGVVVSIAIVSTTLNFLEPFLEVVKQVKFLSLLSYFRPVDVVRTGVWPVAHFAVLLTLALVGWTIGLLVLCRRDIPTA